VLGIKIRGSQPFTLVQKPTTDVGKVLVNDVAEVSADGTVNFVHLCPHALNGPLLTQALNYQMYAFRKVRLEYITTAPASQLGAFCLLYCRDPDEDSLGGSNIPMTFAEAREVTPVTILPYRQERSALEWTYNGDQLWYCEAGDGSSKDDMRLCMQGQVRAFSDSVATAATVGYLQIYYECDLFYPTPSADAAFASKRLKVAREDKQALADYAEHLRSKRGKSQGSRFAMPFPTFSARAQALGMLVDEDAKMTDADLSTSPVSELVEGFEKLSIVASPTKRKNTQIEPGFGLSEADVLRARAHMAQLESAYELQKAGIKKQKSVE